MKCPSCSQDIGFRSEQAPYAVCGSCDTLVVRKDINLEIIGRVGECQPDSSPLQVGAGGSYLNRSFQVLGRIQVTYGEGYWNEWYLGFSDGTNGWLGDAMGQYFLSKERPPQNPEPVWNQGSLQLGSEVQLSGKSYLVLDRKKVTVSSLEGELGTFLEPRSSFWSVDLRSKDGDGLTVDFSTDVPTVFEGRYVPYAELNLNGLRHGEDPTVAVPQEVIKAVRCASCGAPHSLSTGPASRMLICQYCGATNDSSGPELKKVEAAITIAAALAEEAAVPIGSTARLRDGQYKVLGFVCNSTFYEGTEYTWKEYLLYNHLTGYRWLSESEGHFTLFEQIEGLPALGSGAVARPISTGLTENDRRYKHFQTSQVTVSQVVGEFYWRVAVGDKSESSDYIAPPFLLSGSVSSKDITWSRGRYIDRKELATMFPDISKFPKAKGVAPNQPNPYLGATRHFHIPALVALLVAWLVISSGILLRGSEQLFQTGPLRMPAESTSKWMTLNHKFEMPSKRDLSLELSADMKARWAEFNIVLTPLGGTPLPPKPVGMVATKERTSTKAKLYFPNLKAGRYNIGVSAKSGPPPPPPRLREAGGSSPVPLLLTLDMTGSTVKPNKGWGVMVLFIPLLFLPYILAWRWTNSFEVRRWYESDYG